MPRLPQLYPWLSAVASAFGGCLSAAQARALAWFSFGMVLARACAVTAVAAELADPLGQKPDTVKQRLRAWYVEADAKAGCHRREVGVRPCLKPLLRWVLKDWPSRRLAVALDATTLGQRFPALVVSVLYKGCAVPVAWKVLPAEAKHARKGEWLALLGQFRRALPRGWAVVVRTDRGLYAKWLYQARRRRGWHPLMRVNPRGTS